MAVIELRMMSRTGCTQEQAFDFLESAKNIILVRRHPYGELPTDLEPRYLETQLNVAVYLYNKQGAEGQLSHSENGISRTYASSDLPEELLREVVPLVKIT